jgi:hypothetical protein
MTSFNLGEWRFGVGVNLTWDLIKSVYSKIKTDLDRRITPEAREFEFDWLESIIDATLNILAGTGPTLVSQAANVLHQWLVNVPDEFVRQEVKGWLQSGPVRENAKALMTALLAGEPTERLRASLVQSYREYAGGSMPAADAAVRIVIKFIGDTIAGSLSDGERVLARMQQAMHSDVRAMHRSIIQLSDKLDAIPIAGAQSISSDDQRLVRAFRLSQKAERFLRVRFKANGNGLGELLRCVSSNVRSFDLALATTLGRFAPVRNQLMHEERPKISASEVDSLLDEVDAILSSHLAQPPSETSLSLPSRQWFVSADGFGEFTTIAEALSRSSDGDQIFILPGVYQETLSIDKPISLLGKGEKPEDVTIAADDDLLEIGSSRVVVDNIAFKTARQHAFGVVLLPGMDRVIVSKCALSVPSGEGLVAMPGSGVSVVECRFEKCRVGARLDSNAAINQCTFTGNNHALLVREAATTAIAQCSFIANQFGLEIRGDGSADVHDNDFQAGSYAIVAVGQPAGRIFSNRYSGYQPDSRLVKMHDAPRLIFED